MNQIHIVHAVIISDKKILLGKRSKLKTHDPSAWAFIGGKVERDETLQDGFLRECRAEIDVIVRPLRKLKEIHKKGSMHFWFEAEVVSGTPRLANDEHTELKWFSMTELELLSPVISEDLDVARNL